VDFVAVLDQVITLLHQRGRLTYRTLKRQFALDDAALEDLKEELIYGQRLAAIVNDDAIGILPLRVIVPITAWQERYAVAPWMVRLDPDPGNGLDTPSAADTFQVRSVSQIRFVRRLRNISVQALQDVTRALAIVLSIS
jgi:mRNA interferase MazF